MSDDDFVVNTPFVHARSPELRFGAGCRFELGTLTARYGRRAALVAGARSLEASGALAEIITACQGEGVSVRTFRVAGEPSPEEVDGIVGAIRQRCAELPDVVLAAGGGSALDAGKAVATLVLESHPAVDYLEGVAAERPLSGRRLPLIAVPTTAGTGSEATKNAVLGRPGRGGFKRSLRHDALVPDIALLDPQLTVDCPASITAACGFDALTQLLESYWSRRATPATDLLARAGLQLVGRSLHAACREGSRDLHVRGDLLLAAHWSGIALANAGLGVVHGLAGPIGGWRRAPHGAICAALLIPALEVTAEALAGEPGVRHADTRTRLVDALESILGGGVDSVVTEDRDEGGSGAALANLIQRLRSWARPLHLPRLADFGLARADLRSLAEESGDKEHPVALGAGGRLRILERAW